MLCLANVRQSWQFMIIKNNFVRLGEKIPISRMYRCGRLNRRIDAFLRQMSFPVTVYKHFIRAFLSTLITKLQALNSRPPHVFPIYSTFTWLIRFQQYADEWLLFCTNIERLTNTFAWYEWRASNLYLCKLYSWSARTQHVPSTQKYISTTSQCPYISFIVSIPAHAVCVAVIWHCQVIENPSPDVFTPIASFYMSSALRR